jgi:translation initiation factor 1A
VFKEEGQGTLFTYKTRQKHLILTSLFIIEYAQVVKMLGNGRVEAQCFDGVKRLALIRGKLRKKVWINQGDIVLLSLRDFQDEKADVIQRYNPDEARQLKSYGELPDTAKINETDNNFGGEEDDEVEFDFDIDDVGFFLYSSCFESMTNSSLTDLNSFLVSLVSLPLIKQHLISLRLYFFLVLFIRNKNDYIVHKTLLGLGLGGKCFTDLAVTLDQESKGYLSLKVFIKHLLIFQTICTYHYPWSIEGYKVDPEIERAWITV